MEEKTDSFSPENMIDKMLSKREYWESVSKTAIVIMPTKRKEILEKERQIEGQH